MIEKILNEIYVTPKVEMTENEYNRLVELATMKAKKIEERAREIYDKEGIVKIEFDGRFVSNRYGERDTEHYKFDIFCPSYQVKPTGEFEKTLFSIPEKMRQRIATKVKNYVQEVFIEHFGEHLYKLNDIKRLEEKTEFERKQFLVWTVTGWLLAVLMLGVVLLK